MKHLTFSVLLTLIGICYNRRMQQDPELKLSINCATSFWQARERASTFDRILHTLNLTSTWPCWGVTLGVPLGLSSLKVSVQTRTQHHTSKGSRSIHKCWQWNILTNET